MQEKNPRAEWFDFVNRYLKEPTPEEHLPIDHREFLQKIKLYFDNRTVMCDGKVDLSYVFLRLKGVLDEFMDREFRDTVNHLKVEIHNLKDKENKDWYDLRTDLERKTQNIEQKLRELDDKLHKELAKLDIEIHKITEELREKLEGELEETKEELLAKIEEISTTIEDALKIAVDNLKEEFNKAIEETKEELSEKIDEVQSDLDEFKALKGQPGGLAELGEDGKVVDSQLPTWTDDVIEVFASYEVDAAGKLSDIHLYEDFKQTEEIIEGEAGKIYIDITKEDPTYMFRWTGKKFIQISCGDVVIGTSEGTAYDGAEGQYNRDAIKSTPSKIVTQWNQSESKATSSTYVAVLSTKEKDSNDQYTAEGIDSIEIPLVTDETAGLMSPSQKELLEKIDGDYASKSELDSTKDELQKQIDEIVDEGTSGKITDLQDQLNNLKDEHEKDVTELKESISETSEKLETEITETKEYVDTKVNDVDVKITEIVDSKGQPGGIATLDDDGMVPSSQLPSYVDDVIDVFATYEKAEDGSLYNIQLYKDAAHTEAVVGETDKIYVDISQDAGPEPVGTLPYYQFRWSGTKFVQITCGGLILGEVDNTAYEGSKGAYNRAAINALPGEVVVSIEDGERTADDITYQIGYNIKSGEDQYGSVESRDITIPAANTKEAGLMTAEDKATLDAIPDTYVTKDEYTGEDKTLQDEIDALKEQHEKDVATLTSDIDAVNTKIDNIEYEEHECADAISNLTTTVDELSKKHDEDVQELTEKIDSNTTKIDTLETTTAKTTEDLDSAESRVSDCESAINANTNNIESLQSSLEGVEQRVAVNEVSISNLDQDVNNLKAKDDELQSQIDSNLEVINELIDSKQDKLTAGTAIDIYEKNGETIIDCTIDTNLYKVVTVLPEKPDEGDENKIFVVPSADQGEENIYVEYLYIIDAWEKIGELHSEVDLSDYYTKEEVDDTVSRLESAISTNAESIEKLDETVEVHTANIKANADDIAELKTSVSTLETTTSTQGESIADLQTKVAENTEAINILDDDLGDLRDSVDDNTQSIEDLKSTLEETTEKVTENTSSIESLDNAVGELESSKQDVLSAGVGIDITDNVVSCTLDTQVFLIVTVLPEVGEENKIYLVPTSEEPGNIYTEYIYIGNAWEKLGEYKADVDLSDYYTKEEVDDIKDGLESEIDTNTSSIDELKTNLGALDTRLTSAEAQVEANTDDIETLQSDLSSTTNRVDTLETTTTNLTSDVEELQGGVQDLGSVTDDLQSQITTNADDISSVTSRVDTLETTTADLTSTTEDLQSQITENTNDLQSQIDTNAENINELESSKQDKLTAGTAIDIYEKNGETIIDCTIDTNLYKVVTVLPEKPDEGDENKIFVVPSSEQGEENIYVEYLYIIDAWEKIGELHSDIDLSDYAKISYVDENVTTLQNDVNAKYDTLVASISDLTGVEHADFEEVTNLISTTKAQVDTNTGDISTLKTQVDTNTSEIDELETEVSDLESSKQDVLTAGTGIAINKVNDDTIIECTIDHTIYKVETVLPEKPDEGDENKIFVIPTSTAEGNVYTEYIYVTDAWEQLGVDLSDYCTKDDTYSKEEVDSMISSEDEKISIELGDYIKEEIADERYATKTDLTSFETEINTTINNLESQISGYVTKDEYNETVNNLQSQIDELKDTNDLLLDYIVQIFENIGPNKD